MNGRRRFLQPVEDVSDKIKIYHYETLLSDIDAERRSRVD